MGALEILCITITIPVEQLCASPLSVCTMYTMCVLVFVCVCVCVRARTRVRACVRVCVCVVSVIVKRPMLPPSVVDGRSRNPLYYYLLLMKPVVCTRSSLEPQRFSASLAPWDQCSVCAALY